MSQDHQVPFTKVTSHSAEKEYTYVKQWCRNIFKDNDICETRPDNGQVNAHNCSKDVDSLGGENSGEAGEFGYEGEKSVDTSMAYVGGEVDSGEYANESRGNEKWVGGEVDSGEYANESRGNVIWVRFDTLDFINRFWTSEFASESSVTMEFVKLAYEKKLGLEEFFNERLVPAEITNEGLRTVEFSNEGSAAAEPYNESLGTTELDNEGLGTVELSNESLETAEYSNESLETVIANERFGTSRSANKSLETEELASVGKGARSDTSKICDTYYTDLIIYICEIINNITFEVTGLASAKSYIGTAITGTHGNFDVGRNDQHGSHQLFDDKRECCVINIQSADDVTNIQSVDDVANNNIQSVDDVVSIQPVDDVTNIQPVGDVTNIQPVDDVANIQPFDDVTNIQPVDDVANIQPVIDVANIEPVDDVANIQPVDDVTNIKPVDEVANIKPADDFTNIQPVDDVTNIQQVDDVANIQPFDDVANIQPVDDVTSIQPVDDVVNIQPVDDVVNIQPVDDVTNIQPVDDVTNIQPVDDVVNIQPVDDVANIQPVDDVTNIQPVDDVPNIHPVDDVTNIQPVDDMVNIQPVDDVTNIQPVDDVVNIQPVDDVVNIQPVDDVTNIQPVDDVANIQPVDDVTNIKPVDEVANIKPADDVTNIQPVDDVTNIQQVDDVANIQPVDDVANIQPVDDVTNIQPVDDVTNIQPVDDVVNIQPVDDVANIQPVDDVTNIQPVDDVTNIQPVDHVTNIQPVDDVVNIQPVDDVANIQPVDDVVNIQPVNDVVNIQPVDNVNNVQPVNDVTNIQPVDDVTNTQPFDAVTNIQLVGDVVSIQPVGDVVNQVAQPQLSDEDNTRQQSIIQQMANQQSQNQGLRNKQMPETQLGNQHFTTQQLTNEHVTKKQSPNGPFTVQPLANEQLPNEEFRNQKMVNQHELEIHMLLRSLQLTYPAHFHTLTGPSLPAQLSLKQPILLNQQTIPGPFPNNRALTNLHSLVLLGQLVPSLLQQQSLSQILHGQTFPPQQVGDTQSLATISPPVRKQQATAHPIVSQPDGGNTGNTTQAVVKQSLPAELPRYRMDRKPRAHTWHDTNETQIPPLSPVIRLSVIEPWTVVSQHKQPPSDPLAVARIYAPSSWTTQRLKRYDIIHRIIDISRSIPDARKFQSAFVARWWNNRYMRQELMKCMQLSQDWRNIQLVKLLVDRCGEFSTALQLDTDNRLNKQDMVEKMLKLLKSGRKTHGTDPRHWNRRHLQKQPTTLDNVTGCAGLSANTDGELTKNSDSSSNSEHQPLTIQRPSSVDLTRILIETTPSHKKTSVCPEYELNSSTVSEQQLSSEVRDDDTVSADVGSPSLHTMELGVFKVQQDCVKHDEETDTRDDTMTLTAEHDLDEPLFTVSADVGSPTLHTLKLGVCKVQQDCVKHDEETDTRDDTSIFTPEHELDEPLWSEQIGSSRPLQPDGTESSITCSDTENSILTIHEYYYEKEVCRRYKLGYRMKVVPSRESLLPNVQSKTFQTLKPGRSIVVQEEGNIVDMAVKLESDSTVGDIDEHELRRLMRQCTWLPLHRLPVPLIQIDVYQNASFTALQAIFQNLVHDPNLGARTTMKYELLRICTFREYPRHNKPFIIRMAGAGFYHASVADEVVCYSCGVRRRGWATKDNPMTLHRSISPTCKFLLENETVNIPVSKVASNNVLDRSLANNDTETSVNATQASADTEPTSSRSSSRAENVSVSQPILPVQTESRAEVESAGAKPSNPTNASKSRSEGHPVGASNAAEGATTVSHIPDVSSEMPKHPHYAVKSVRLASYRGWSVNLNQTPEMMADAGYFYAGLRHWTNDDNVWVEHARWSPDCLYLKKMKGNDFIDLVKNAIIDPEQDVREESRTVSRFQDQQGSRHEQINRILLGDAAQSILGMGYETSMVRRAIDIVLNSQGEAGIRAEALMEEVLNIEDRENELNLASLQISSASGQSKDTGYATFQTGQGVKNDATKVTDSQFIRADGGAQGVSNPLPKPVGTTKKACDKSAVVDTDKLEEARKIRAENRLLKEQTLCKVCLDKEVSIVFLPCGHLVTCDVCAPAMRKCPICRALVKGNVKTFLS